MAGMMGPRPLGLCSVAMMGMPRVRAALTRRSMLARARSRSSGGMAAARRSWASMMSSCEKRLRVRGISA